jgi:hypothetical protein
MGKKFKMYDTRPEEFGKYFIVMKGGPKSLKILKLR